MTKNRFRASTFSGLKKGTEHNKVHLRRSTTERVELFASTMLKFLEVAGEDSGQDRRLTPETMEVLRQRVKPPGLETRSEIELHHLHRVLSRCFLEAQISSERGFALMLGTDGKQPLGKLMTLIIEHWKGYITDTEVRMVFILLGELLIEHKGAFKPEVFVNHERALQQASATLHARSVDSRIEFGTVDSPSERRERKKLDTVLRLLRHENDGLPNEELKLKCQAVVALLTPHSLQRLLDVLSPGFLGRFSIHLAIKRDHITWLHRHIVQTVEAV